MEGLRIGNSILDERSAFRISPDCRKNVGLAGLCIYPSLRWLLRISLWIRAYRQDMWPRGQRRVVTLIEPQITNLNAVDEQIDGFEITKIGGPGYNQAGAVAGIGHD